MLPHKSEQFSPGQLFEIDPIATFWSRVEMARRYAQRGDILAWGKVCFPDKFELPFCTEMHQYFVEICEEPFTNTEAPRNHAKTTIKCFLIPIFLALNKPGTFKHFLNVQATGVKALSVNTAIKSEIEENEILRALYGNQVGENKWADGQFVLRNGTIFTAISASQSIRGMNYKNIRPDYIVIDDLYDEEDLNNSESTEKKNKWFWGSLYPARAKHRRCSIHVQGTAINNQDILHELKSKKRWKSKTFAAIKNWDTKEVLWPELNTFESLMSDKEDMGSIIFFREMQNERRDDATSIVKAHWLEGQEFDPNDLVFDGHFQYRRCVLGGDPSIGEKNENDNTSYVLMLVGKYTDGKNDLYYVIGIWDEQLSLDKRVLLLQRIQDGRPANRKITRAYIEAIAGFKDFAAEARRRTTVPISEVDQVPDKITNLENKSHFFENKRVFFSKNIEKRLRQKLYDQLTTNHPKNDDIRDALLLPLEQGKKDAMSYAD